MQIKKFLAKFGKYEGIVEVVFISDNEELFTVLDGPFLRSTWFSVRRHPNEIMVKVGKKKVRALTINKCYIARELTPLELELWE
jgi:hypothetical protein